MKFEDFQTPVHFSSTFQGLEISTFKDEWEHCSRSLWETVRFQLKVKLGMRKPDPAKWLYSETVSQKVTFTYM